jgi:hypothetical protein
MSGEPSLPSNNVIITRHTKIVYNVYNKMRTLIISTNEVLGEHNAALIITRVMRELNKSTDLYGFEKRQLTLAIVTMLLETVGCPTTSSELTAIAILKLIEFIYVSNMHRYKNGKKTCRLS